MPEWDEALDDFPRDLLFPGGPQRAAINPATAHATIEVEDLDKHLALMATVQRRLPLHLIGNALHEGAHHRSLCSLVGTALSVLAADIRTRLDTGPESDPATVILQAKYEFVLQLLRPLFEGLAVFAEHDLHICEGPICPLFIGHIASKVISDLPIPGANADLAKFGAQYAAESTTLFNAGVIIHRSSKHGMGRKKLVLKDPYRFRHSGGYLLGYLLVKRLWAVLIGRSGRPLESALFFEFVHGAIFEDCIFAAWILERPKHATLEALKANLGAVAKWLNYRLSWMENEADADLVRMFEEALQKMNAVEAAALLFDLKKRGIREQIPQIISKMSKRLDEIGSSGPVGAEELHDILGQRQIFRFATGPARFRVTEGRVIVLDRHSNLDYPFNVIFASPSLIDLPQGDYDGVADLFFHVNDGVRIVYRSVVDFDTLPDTIGTISFSGKVAAIVHSKIEQRNRKIDLSWAKAVESRTGSRLAERENALRRRLAGVRSTQGWRLLRPLIHELTDQVSPLFVEGAAVVKSAKRELFDRAAGRNGLMGLFEDEQESHLDTIILTSAWASAVNDNLGGMASKLSAEPEPDRLGQTSRVLGRWGAPLIVKSGEAIICPW